MNDHTVPYKLTRRDPILFNIRLLTDKLPLFKQRPIAITGSRFENNNDQPVLFSTTLSLVMHLEATPENERPLVYVGDAFTGVDHLIIHHGEGFAKQVWGTKQKSRHPLAPNCTYKQAGRDYNHRDVLMHGAAELSIMIWDGQSYGTRRMIDWAIDNGRPHFVYTASAGWKAYNL